MITSLSSALWLSLSSSTGSSYLACRLCRSTSHRTAAMVPHISSQLRRHKSAMQSATSHSSTDMVTNLFDNNGDDDTSPSANDGNASSVVRPQSVAVIGAGAVGSYYGARLWQAGHHVQFYARRGQRTDGSSAFDALKQKGMSITSIHGNFEIPADKLQVFDSTEAMQPTPDWILIGLKSTALSAIPDLILPLLLPSDTNTNNKTNILVLMNGLVDEDLIHHLKQATGQSTDDPKEPLKCCRTFYGGLAFIAANRLGPGKIHHYYAGPIAAGVASTQVTGDGTCPDTTVRQEIQSLWQPVQAVPCQWEDNLLLGRWRKMLWNLPFNGISVAMGGIPTNEIVTDPGLRALARHVMQETLAVAQAECGPASLTDSHVEQMFAITDGMDAYRPSTMIDLLEKRPMEVLYLFRKPLERAQALGVPTPHLFTIVTMIEALQRKHNLF